ncbi:MAG: energy-coupled thiamine transporter ThiT [Bacillus sp. (in: firmicutes)]
MNQSRKLNLVGMIEAAFLAAFAMVLDLLPSIKVTPFVSISIAMIPIFLAALRWGMKVGVLSGFLWGALQVVTGDAYILTVAQFLMEYFIAFACIGFAGLFYQKVKVSFEQKQQTKAVLWIVVAVIVGSIARYIWHFIAGVLFWGSYAPEGMSAVWYSFVINGGAMIGSAVLCAAVLAVLLSTSPRLVVRKAISNQAQVNVLK